MKSVVVALAAVAFVACAGPKKEAKDCPADGAGGMAANGEGHGAGHGEHGVEHRGAVGQFHDVLKPLWHAAEGAERTTNTCAAVGQFRTAAAAITAEAADKAKAAALEAAVAGLDAPCAAADHAGFDVAFHAVHDAFHAIAEASH